MSARSNAIAAIGPGILTPDEAQRLLDAKLGPWLQELGLVVEECGTRMVRLRLPHSPRLARPGGTVSGQALMACADTAMGVAIFAAYGGYREVTTVGQTTSFMRPIGTADTVIDAVVRKLGRNLIFAEATFRVAGSDVPCAHATATWAVLPADTR